MFDGRASVLECCRDDGEALVGLFGYVLVVRANRASSGDVNLIADSDGA
jgi:hypothetical protein